MKLNSQTSGGRRVRAVAPDTLAEPVKRASVSPAVFGTGDDDGAGIDAANAGVKRGRTPMRRVPESIVPEVEEPWLKRKIKAVLNRT